MSLANHFYCLLFFNSFNMTLFDLIVDRIRQQEAISFRDYMEMALYHRDLGYFTSPGSCIGKRGDFFTSPFISSAFGAMIGRQIEEFRKQMSGDFTIIEYGAGTGLLCHDILQYLKTNSKDFRSIRYVIIEKSPVLKTISKNYLSHDVEWFDDINMLGKVDGCIISNELFDNFPVHRLVRQNHQYMEIFVDYQNGFREILKPPKKDILDIIDYNPVEFPEGFRMEVCADAMHWFQNVTGVLNKGYVVTIDYGYLLEELIHLQGVPGTLRCYYKHEVNFDPYQRPGEQDITSDVNFSSLCHWGSKNGFQFTGYVSQSHFLRGLGFIPYLSNTNDSNENKMFAYNTLVNEMGKKFKVLIQQKNMQDAPLSGLSFQQPEEKRMCLDHQREKKLCCI
jgi:SAM-dependent MidA family methyltransferase